MRKRLRNVETETLPDEPANQFVGDRQREFLRIVSLPNEQHVIKGDISACCPKRIVGQFEDFFKIRNGRSPLFALFHRLSPSLAIVLAMRYRFSSEHGISQALRLGASFFFIHPAEQSDTSHGGAVNVASNPWQPAPAI
jgi:hypothetical protein